MGDKYGGSTELQQIVATREPAPKYRTIPVVAAIDVMMSKDDDEAMNSVGLLIQAQPDCSLKSIKTGVANLEWILNALGVKMDQSTGWLEVPGVGYLERGPDQRWKMVTTGRD